MLELTRVICPVDFSEPSLRAVQHADAIATWWGAQLVVLHVYTPAPEVVPAMELANVGGEIYEEADLRPLERLALEFAQKAGVNQQRSRVLIRVGWPADEIVRHAGAGSDRLIVIGTHGAQGFRRMVLGSVAEKVVRNALCPVITVPPHAETRSHPPFRTILCPVEFSDSSLHAVPLAMAFAKEGDSRLTLLHIVQGAAVTETVPPGALSGPPPVSASEAESQARLRELLPPDAGDWCTPLVQVVHGAPGDEILRCAAVMQADLIVMGVRKRSGFDQALFGSTTNQVLRGATCPVMTERA
jgi:nucleotide-binding universal stress UspA family protein